ncbi:MAG: transcriptional regulator [Nitrospirales bacterium]|nr:MAG: transcriptional regulator [Nitrospirales bacterium]
MSVSEVHDLLERLCNLLRMEMRTFGLKFGLQPVQIEALTYLTQCNRYSDTPQAVTEYLGLTKGTVSQSLKVLEQKGLLRKQQDQQDKRIVHLTPTTKGKKLIEQSIPAKGLEAALKMTGSSKIRELKEILRATLRGMQHNNKRKTFAACHTCRFNEQHREGYICGLTQEPLSRQEIRLICREHQYPA